MTLNLLVFQLFICFFSYNLKKIVLFWLFYFFLLFFFIFKFLHCFVQYSIIFQFNVFTFLFYLVFSSMYYFSKSFIWVLQYSFTRAFSFFNSLIIVCLYKITISIGLLYLLSLWYFLVAPTKLTRPSNKIKVKKYLKIFKKKFYEDSLTIRTIATAFWIFEEYYFTIFDDWNILGWQFDHMQIHTYFYA